MPAAGSYSSPFPCVALPPSVITVPTAGPDYATLLPVRESRLTPGVRLLPRTERLFLRD
uniref:Uncharacterized protein n=1 Tax=Anguilla anguilla TaxID=7936 RepID=A0A0E9Q5V0_ANGAN